MTKSTTDKIKNDAKAVADALTDAFDATKDFHTSDENKPVKDQRWVKDIEHKE
jgi:hypothetical protein